MTREVKNSTFPLCGHPSVHFSWEIFGQSKETKCSQSSLFVDSVFADSPPWFAQQALQDSLPECFPGLHVIHPWSHPPPGGRPRGILMELGRVGWGSPSRPGSQAVSRYSTMFQHRTPRSLRILNSDLVFQVVLKACFSREEDRTYLTLCYLGYKF